MVASFRQQLLQRLQHPLPGLDVQMEMAPPIRGRNPKIPDNVRLSAVLILLYPHEGTWRIPFMRRSQDGRVHGGQVSFPGGRYEEPDGSYQQTALREAEEELGIDPKTVELLAPLTEIYIPPSNFMVYPQLAIAQQRPDFRLDPVEVAALIEVELDELARPEIRGQHQVDVFGGNVITAPGYTVYDQHLIWGGTAMMAAELVQLYRELGS
ncbi:MAG: CoA pyrophosphatase [Bacteroidota bacterium]